MDELRSEPEQQSIWQQIGRWQQHPQLVQVAAAIALLFHIIGVIGVFFHIDWIVEATPFNLLLMAALVFFTQPQLNGAFVGWVLAAFAVGMFVEIVGVNTGLLFGHYRYGWILGKQWMGVPFIIGINWVVVVYCSGVAMQLLHDWLHQQMPLDEPEATRWWRISLILDGAMVATAFDWVLEPVAVKLGYWEWLGNGEIPLLNYACWFVFSALLLFLFDRLHFFKRNLFAVHLLIIQLLFFCTIRLFA